MEDYRAGYRILVADDDINVHQSLNTYFRREGYQMISAYDGQEAIDHVRKSRPDIVLLDIMMPKMDGLMVCREIRKETNLPIIMLTAKGEEFDKLNVVFTSNLPAISSIVAHNQLAYSITIRGSLSFWDPEKITCRPLYPELKATSILAWKRKQPFSPAVSKWIQFAKETLRPAG